MDFPEIVAAVRALCGRRVVSRLLDGAGAETVRWEGVLTEEELEEPGAISMFTVGARPLLLDPADLGDASRDPDGTIRLAVTDGTTVEIVPI